MAYLLMDLVSVAATLFTILIFVRIVLSWVGSRSRHPLVLLVYRLTEPLLSPVRALLPSFGGVDFSPVILLFGIQILKQVLMSILAGMAQGGS